MLTHYPCCHSTKITSSLALDADHLMQLMDNLHEIALRIHDGFDVLVGCGRFIDHVGILPALYGSCSFCVIFNRNPASCLTSRHDAAGSVRAGLEGIRVPLSADNE